MDQFVFITKPSSSTLRKNTDKGASKRRETVKPYSKSPPSTSTSALNRRLMSTLSDESNPITHSDAANRVEYIASSVTGHQVSEERGNRRLYLQHRAMKISVQENDEVTTSTETSKIFEHVRVYIDGFLDEYADSDIKRQVVLNGGQMMYSASGATHIVSSQALSGSKMHALLTKKSRSKKYLVTPAWIYDSISAGKRRSERQYSIITPASSALANMFQK